MSTIQEYLARFDFNSGVLCLDFANTAGWHASAEPLELLENITDLVYWGQLAGILPERQARQLLNLAAARPGEAQVFYQRAILLREALYGIWSACARRQPAAPGDLAVLNREVQRLYSQAAVAPASGSFAWEWQAHSEPLDALLWAVVRSAVEVLTGEKVHQVGECQDDRGCGTIFLDTSRNHTRRWCSMETCGNRAKAQRHYGRARQAAKPD